MNNVNIIGNLTRDPEMRTTNNGTAVTSFNIAINSGYGDKKSTAFVPIKVWGKSAENCNQFLSKGSKVAITGRIDTGSYEKEGKTVYTWEVVANNVEFLSNFRKSNNLNETEDFYDKEETIPF